MHPFQSACVSQQVALVFVVLTYVIGHSFYYGRAWQFSDCWLSITSNHFLLQVDWNRCTHEKFCNRASTHWVEECATAGLGGLSRNMIHLICSFVEFQLKQQLAIDATRLSQHELTGFSVSKVNTISQYVSEPVSLRPLVLASGCLSFGFIFAEKLW